MAARKSYVWVLWGLALPLAAQSLAPPVLPAAATAVQVAPGANAGLKFHFLAAGKQIYKCENGGWSKSSTPEATLYDVTSDLKIHHSAGPSWSTADGQSTVKALGATAIHFAAPDGVSIDWLKLEVDKASRTGIFGDVGIIQRVYTGAGMPPAAMRCTASQTYESPYTAHYYFWVVK
jgi:hypothetical protein